MDGSVAIVIVNWNGKQYLETCLPSIMAQTYNNFEVVVVDNASTDGSTDFLRCNFPQIKLIPLHENVGFAAGNNAAIRETQTDFVATINNDIILEDDWLELMVASASISARNGMCASRILLLPERRRIDSTGIEVDKAGVAWNRHFGLEAEKIQVISGEVFGPSAAAALYRREMLNDVGLFDEDYFAFYEDVDLAWRARLRGWRCQYVQHATAFHHHSASARRNPRLKNYWIARNKAWTIIKNYPAGPLLIHLPFVMLYEFAPCLFSLFRFGDPSKFLGKVAALKQFRSAFAKRREIQSSRTMQDKEILQLMSAPKSPFSSYAV